MVTWEAEEHIIQDRNTWWFVGLFTVGAGLSVLAFFLQWWTFLALVILSVAAILISALKPPRKIKYSLDQKTLTEGGQKHSLQDYKAFGILNEKGHYSAVLIPKKRLGLQLKVYFPEKNGEVIVDTLGAKLPMEDIKIDFLDKLVNFLRI